MSWVAQPMGVRNEVDLLGLGGGLGLHIFWLSCLVVVAFPAPQATCARLADHAFSLDSYGRAQ